MIGKYVRIKLTNKEIEKVNKITAHFNIHLTMQ